MNGNHYKSKNNNQNILETEQNITFLIHTYRGAGIRKWVVFVWKLGLVNK